VTRISSNWTTFHKRAFPAFWFGFLALFVGIAFVSGSVNKDPTFLVVPLFMACFGYFIMRKFVWDLVDEVWDCGDSLLIRNRGEETVVRLSNIMNVNASTYMNPPRITLRLIEPGPFGSEIAFSPVTGFVLNPFARNKVADDLILRVDQAKPLRAI
jgi:hypothetical protein